MNYRTTELFEALLDEVEEQGGALLPEAHVSEAITFTVPPYQRESTQRRATCGCGNTARMVHVYEPGEDSKDKSGFVTACAVCDDVGLWPRYVDSLLAIDPDLLPEDDDEQEDTDG